MTQGYEPTASELKSQWRRTGLWRHGHSFEQDIQVPVIAMTLRAGVIARHKSKPLPEQGSLDLETA